jgi:hypothetical protein
MRQATLKPRPRRTIWKIDRRFRPELSVSQVLAWADAHHRRTGRWPQVVSGPIAHSLGETWRAIDSALRHGRRGFPGGSSLARLLAQRRGVRNSQDLPPLTRETILAWADAHHRRTGAWPSLESGPIADAPGERWNAVDQALRQGGRGLAGGSSLAQLLAQERGIRNRSALPPADTEAHLGVDRRPPPAHWPVAELQVGAGPGHARRELGQPGLAYSLIMVSDLNAAGTPAGPSARRPPPGG